MGLSHLWVSAVPIDSTEGIKMLYVFVDIQVDNAHFLDTVKFNFTTGQSMALVCTVQFAAALQVIVLFQSRLNELRANPPVHFYCTLLVHV